MYVFSRFFRLQKSHSPKVLNSFQVWPISKEDAPDAYKTANLLLYQLKGLLGKVISKCTDDNGLVNYIKARTVEEYPIFEEAVCELQGMYALPDPEAGSKLQNRYNLTRFAFMSSLLQLST
jgi:hypothetical protein